MTLYTTNVENPRRISESSPVPYNFHPAEWFNLLFSSSTQLLCDELEFFESSTQTCFVGAFGRLLTNRQWSEYKLKFFEFSPQFSDNLIETYKTAFINSPHNFSSEILKISQILRCIRTNPQKPIPSVVFAAMLRQYEFVEKVIYWDNKDELSIMTVVNNSTRQQREFIYGRQWDLLQLFNNISVDFNLIDRHDALLDELITVGETAWIIQS
jgi:hypothetical protein